MNVPVVCPAAMVSDAGANVSPVPLLNRLIVVPVKEATLSATVKFVEATRTVPEDGPLNVAVLGVALYASAPISGVAPLHELPAASVASASPE